MPTTHYGSIPVFLDALRELAEMALEIRAWEDKPAGIQGFENMEQRITIALSTIRSHYRLAPMEPYEAGIQRYKEDIKRVLKQATLDAYEVGRKVVSRNPGVRHHGIVAEVTVTSVTIRHDDDCCEPGLLSTVEIYIAPRCWKQIIVRRSAWERLMDDD